MEGSVIAMVRSVLPAAQSAGADREDVTIRLWPATSKLRGVRSRVRLRDALGVVFFVLFGCPVALASQGPEQLQHVATADVVVIDSPPALLKFLNRPITVFRASILSRVPEERAAAAAAKLDRHVNQVASLAISTRRLGDVIIISVGGQAAFVLTPQDVDSLSGETLDTKVSEAVSNLQLALGEAVELRTPRRMLRNAGELLLGVVVFTLLLFGAKRVHARLVVRLPMLAEQKLAKLSPGDVLVAESRAIRLFARGLHLVFALVVLLLGFSWLTFSLRRFPYTRPLGESLRAFLLGRIAAFGERVLEALPDLFVVLLIVLVTRFLVRLSNHFFQAVEAKQIVMPGLFPETARATRRLVAIFLSLLAVLVAYPHVPGSNSEVFKGLSVFIGLIVSLGSRGIVDQMMSGLMLTYSRAVRIGDFVKIANIEGTVVETAALSTKVKTPRGEEVTIPNSVVVADVTMNYSRFADSEGVYVPTVASIGYDAPWRQVEALLLQAADRTPGVCKRPGPVVRQSALGDFCVQYTLLVCLEHPQTRGATLSALHANILDAFNDCGVQIMSPHYESDPLAPKIVPRDRWHAWPAAPASSAEPISAIPEPHRNFVDQT
jgi:small-conductance mechanosensitive channel